jgi:hypothetical protein
LLPPVNVLNRQHLASPLAATVAAAPRPTSQRRSLFHALAERSRLRLLDSVNANIQRGSDELTNLFHGLMEDDFIEANGDLLPLALDGLVELVGIGIEALVADDE